MSDDAFFALKVAGAVVGAMAVLMTCLLLITWIAYMSGLWTLVVSIPLFLGSVVFGFMYYLRRDGVI